MIIEDNGVLAIRGLEEDCWRALSGALRGFGVRWDELNARSLNRQATRWALAALAPLRPDVEREFPGWVLPLQAEDTVAGNIPVALRKKTRQQVRQSMREFAERGPLTLDRPRDVREALAFFGEMDELHTARWERVSARGSFANPRWVAFHRAVIEAGVPSGSVTLLRVRAAAETIGVVYGFLQGSRFLALQTGFRHYESTALRSGYVSHAIAMQHLASTGITDYDFLPDSENSYKRLLAEPDNLYTTLRFQRPRLRFLLERTAVSLRSKGVAPATQDSSITSPSESS
jgi:CelD/BcsL family acetyltransferase involved in cellulose biosynthesis